MIKQLEFLLPEYPYGFHLITHHVIEAIGVLPHEGLMNIFIKHTSAGLTINENADPTVLDDFNVYFQDLVPESYSKFKHIYEGGDDMPAHIKSSLIGQTLTIPISNGKLNLGIWQGIYLGEFRYSGGKRKIVITIFY